MSKKSKGRLSGASDISGKVPVENFKFKKGEKPRTGTLPYADVMDITSGTPVGVKRKRNEPAAVVDGHAVGEGMKDVDEVMQPPTSRQRKGDSEISIKPTTGGKQKSNAKQQAAVEAEPPPASVKIVQKRGAKSGKSAATEAPTQEKTNMPAPKPQAPRNKGADVMKGKELESMPAARRKGTLEPPQGDKTSAGSKEADEEQEIAQSENPEDAPYPSIEFKPTEQAATVTALAKMVIIHECRTLTNMTAKSDKETKAAVKIIRDLGKKTIASIKARVKAEPPVPESTFDADEARDALAGLRAMLATYKEEERLLDEEVARLEREAAADLPSLPPVTSDDEAIALLTSTDKSEAGGQLSEHLDEANEKAGRILEDVGVWSAAFTEAGNSHKDLVENWKKWQFIGYPNQQDSKAAIRGMVGARSTASAAGQETQRSSSRITSQVRPK